MNIFYFSVQLYLIKTDPAWPKRINPDEYISSSSGDCIDRPRRSGEVRAALEDDFHHFRVHLRHDHQTLIDITGEALRFPYSACPQATEPLRDLIGMRLSPIAHSVTRQTDAQHQCTHLLDLAGLALAAALRPPQVRRYDIQVPLRVNDRTEPSLQLNGVPFFAWVTQVCKSRPRPVHRYQPARRHGALGVRSAERRRSRSRAVIAPLYDDFHGPGVQPRRTGARL